MNASLVSKLLTVNTYNVKDQRQQARIGMTSACGTDIQKVSSRPDLCLDRVFRAFHRRISLHCRLIFVHSLQGVYKAEDMTSVDNLGITSYIIIDDFSLQLGLHATKIYFVAEI